MKKTDIKTSQLKNSFSYGKSYSIAEIMAAGGATAFANKVGKKPQNAMKRLKGFTKEAFLTDDEAENALETLNKTK